MSDDPDVEASPLRRRRSTATQIVASPPEEPAAVATEPDEPPGRRPQRRHISRRYLATVFAGSLVVATLVGLVAAYATSKAAPRYQSLALVEIDQPRAIAVSPDDGVVAKLSRLRYKYSGLMRTDTFAAPVAQKLGLNVNQVTGSVFAVVDASSLLIGVG